MRTRILGLELLGQLLEVLGGKLGVQLHIALSLHLVDEFLKVFLAHLPTEACTQYYADGRAINAEIQDEIMEYMSQLEDMTGKKFGDLNNPLLVSVRSGARASMPGMMDFC